MKNRGASVSGEHAGWEVLFEYGAPQNFVNGVTTLFAFTNYGDDYSEFALFVENQDGSNAVRGVLDGSHGGVRKADNMQGFADIAAGDEGLAEIDYSCPATYVRGQVVNSSGSTVSGRWALLAKQRGGSR